MPSGKRARQQRREAATAVRTPPAVRSKGVGGVRPRQASPRALTIAGGVVLVAVIAVVLGVLLSKGGGNGSSSVLKNLPDPGSATSPIALDGAPDAMALYKGIPQKGLVLGKPSAPVEMEMFIDVQCPICQRYEVDSLPTIVNKYIRNGKVQLHVLPWAFLGPQSFSGRLGVIAASFQNKSLEYAKVLYDNQGQEESGWLDSTMMARIAASVTGLDLQKWWKDVNGSAAKSIAGDVDTLAKTANVQGTPTVLIGRSGGKLHDIMPPGYAPTLQRTEQGLNAALANG